MVGWTEGNGGERQGTEGDEEGSELLDNWNYFLEQKKREKEQILDWHNVLYWLFLRRGRR